MRELMLEVIHAANALGFDLPESLAEKQLERTRTMGAYKASTLLDFERGQPLEMENLFEEPLRQARKAGGIVSRVATSGTAPGLAPGHARGRAQFHRLLTVGVLGGLVHLLARLS